MPLTALSFLLCFLAIFCPLHSFMNNVQLTLWAPAAYRVTRSFSHCTRCGAHPNNGAVQRQACLCLKVISSLINRLKKTQLYNQVVNSQKDLFWKPLDSLSIIKKKKKSSTFPTLNSLSSFTLSSPLCQIMLGTDSLCALKLANPLLFYSYSIFHSWMP